jgi:hypothetical protein
MKKMKTKTTRSKGRLLPAPDHFITPSRGVRHTDYRALYDLQKGERPKPTPEVLAALIGALDLPKTRQGAGEALVLIWECALVISEQNSDLLRFDLERAEREKKHDELVELIGFDIKKLKLPITHKKFLSLLNRKHRDGVKIKGKELTGEDLFRAFMRDYLPEEVAILHGSFVRTAHGILPEIETRDAVIEKMVDKALGFHQREGWSESDDIVSKATDFAYWRAERVSRNKVRTKGNLNKGVLKKGEKNNQKKV